MNIRPLILTAAILGTIFQVGHFFEHAIQAHMWLFIDRTQPWMSGLACMLSLLLNSNMTKGMELLHLGGNLVFLVTLGLWVSLLTGPARKVMALAFFIEALHLTEHVNLTSTVFLYGRAVGWSTLFGFAPDLLGHNGAVGFRVLWHFVMNLIPTGFMVYAMTLPKPQPLPLYQPCANWDCRGSDAC